MIKTIRIGIIGFGNIGKKRFKALSEIKRYNTKIIYIVDKIKPKNINKEIKYYREWKDVITINVDLLIVSTPTSVSKVIVNKLCGIYNILVEKPVSNNFSEIKNITEKSVRKKKILKVGYNLRFDDGLILAKKLIKNKSVGKIYYVKITYSNGAARTNSNKVGSLLDMGTHSINLLIWLLENNNFKIMDHTSQKNEFMNKRKIDNGFIFLKSKKIIASVHHGFCTWKNDFYLEISGSKGFIRIKSLSKWKNEIVSLGIRNFPDGKPKIKKWAFHKDNSWKNEMKFVLNKILNKNKDLKFINFENQNTLKVIKNII